MSDARDLILNVDDDDAGRYVKTRILRQSGYEVVEAHDGRSALARVAELKPRLVLLDVVLPDIDGLTVCAEIKRDHPEVLVLQISASLIAGEDRVRGLGSGADSYLTQPVAPDELVAVVQALLRLRQAEEALRHEQERSRLIVDAAEDYAIVTTGADRRVTSWNSGAERLFGWSEAEALGRPLEEFYAEEERAEALLAFGQAEAGPVEDERWRVHRNGEQFFGSGVLHRLKDGAPGYLSIARDDTARRRGVLALEDTRRRLEHSVVERTRERDQHLAQREQAEAALRQAQKMEAVGRLTGGVAHDFNNLLTVILGNLDLLRRKLGDGLGAHERLLSGAEEAGKRAASMTQRLLAFSRRQSLEPTSVSPHALLNGMQDLIARTVGAHIRLRFDADPALPPVWCDANQLESAVLNLVINARDAMPDGGELTVGARAVRAEDTPRSAELAPGEYVAVSVVDTGAGMSPEVLASIFEPFFTTKPTGQGTGLGMSQVYGFIRQSEGGVDVTSAPGRGTTVTLYLPRCGTLQPPAVADVSPESPAHARDGVTVLVVEDEDMVRGLVEETLRDAGFKVVSTGDPAEALAMIENGRAEVDVLLTDIGLPTMNGRQLLNAARELRPSLRALVMTGYDADAAGGGAPLGPGAELMTKPFALAALPGRVNALLTR